LDFTVLSKTINFQGDEVPGFVVADITNDTTTAPLVTAIGAIHPTNIPNGKTAADMEWFALGERTAPYRNIGWPKEQASKTLVDFNHRYDYLDISYFYTDEGVHPQKSEKVLTLLCKADVTINTSANTTTVALITGITGADPGTTGLAAAGVPATLIPGTL